MPLENKVFAQFWAYWSIDHTQMVNRSNAVDFRKDVACRSVDNIKIIAYCQSIYNLYLFSPVLSIINTKRCWLKCSTNLVRCVIQIQYGTAGDGDDREGFVGSDAVDFTQRRGLITGPSCRTATIHPARIVREDFVGTYFVELTTPPVFISISFGSICRDLNTLVGEAPSFWSRLSNVQDFFAGLADTRSYVD